MKEAVQLRMMQETDWTQVANIYREGIETGLATFEKEVPSWESWNSNHITSCRLVAEISDQILGWAALSAVSSRCVYGGVAEVSVYVAEKARGQRIGKALLQELIFESERNGYWSLQSGIFPENKASISLHEKAGFRHIGYKEAIGSLDGIWKDNILMERRSKVIGRAQKEF